MEQQNSVWDIDAVGAFARRLLAADRSQAAELINSGLRGATEPGDTVDAGEAGNGIGAVAVIAADVYPQVLDGAPDTDQLRAKLQDMDTELTPARRVAGQAVLARVSLPQGNEWLDGLADEQRQAALAAVDALAGLVAAD
ncbi:hypothetical protein [Nakamurella aerolata]|uniref:Uncharacterized protein n=1 Tax=Nakamurella aerolata TaxID=1656892 RepID=A0A849A5Q8_9ACTN|nr:hypothetical protein [Nakamurella aerolata]NNG35899.1 hypothetical protein [Nakamurella aerolata]